MWPFLCSTLNILLFLTIPYGKLSSKKTLYKPSYLNKSKAHFFLLRTFPNIDQIILNKV